MNTTVNGRRVYILAIDSDPAAQVWVVFADNPDEQAFVMRSQIVGL